MPKDFIIFGALAGILGNIVKEIIVWTLHLLGYVRYTFAHIAAGYFVSPDFLDNPVALITGIMADFTLASFLGIVLLLLLRYTGKDYAIIKGFTFGAITYVIIFGFVKSFDVTKATLATPLPNLVLFFPHVIFGSTSAWFINKYDYKKII